MKSQGNNLDQSSFKIVFSQIHCKINIKDEAPFSLVVRIGKKSSKYTEKISINHSQLTFQNTLQVPFDEKLFANQNLRKQKCEIMLYKFKQNRQKQTKQLIGMASVLIGNEMFDQQHKKLRLTNSFDKEAYVQCLMKIQLGEAEVSNNSESRISSFYMKSPDQSRIELPELKSRQKTRISSSITKIDPIGFNRATSSLKKDSQQDKQDNSSLKTLDKHYSLENFNNQSQKHEYKSDSHLQSVEPTKTSEEFISQIKESDEQKTKLIDICNALQSQNQVLINKIDNLQNQILNQTINSNKSGSESPKISRPVGIVRRSTMIKKNLNQTITSNPPSQKQNSAQKLVQLIPNQLKSQTQNFSHFLEALRRPDPKDLKQIEDESSTCFHPLYQGDSSSLNKVNSNMTFAGERDKNLTKRTKLGIDPVIEVTYKPVNRFYPQKFVHQRQNSMIENQIPETERRNSRSYQKFSGKKKHQIIGWIKSPDNSQNLSYFDNVSQKNNEESVMISKPPQKFDQIQDININKNKQNPNSKESTKKYGTTNLFLDFLNDKEENHIQQQVCQSLVNLVAPKENKQNEPKEKQNQTEQKIKSRITLKQLDIKAKQFRINQKDLRIANQKILQQNLQLKEQKKILLEKIQQKSQLSEEEFENLKKQIVDLKIKVEANNKAKLESEFKLANLIAMVNGLEEENVKLKKDLKEQRINYEYYLKTTVLNDFKEKEKHKHHENEIEKQKLTQSHFSNQLNKSSNISEHQISSIEKSQTSVKKVNHTYSSIFNHNKRQEETPKNKITESKSFQKKSDSVLYNKKQQGQNLFHINFERQTKNNLQLGGDQLHQASSLAVSKLKQVFKPSIPKPPQMKQIYNSNLLSPSRSANETSRIFGGNMGGLSGTGETIFHNKGKINGAFLHQ